ncbi:hypothetical protein CDEST_07692 [Colletotrichum destructivum]|uniref:Yeast cell wall synthesis Kre9/Knh1-like N-terminal domain-containing protein n=1 Tax=Colletotrichum destructivum TaxID=34406 RepID=A0AAX4II15_9PEZI|nr:hypothetical protein CDEST_07692 [Colletotrichum destructivum]
MFSKTTVAITSLLALAQAIKVTKPAKGDEWDASSSNEITWDTVNTDPKQFEIVVVNQSGFPEVSTTIAKVNSADGKYELKDTDLAAGDRYRINFLSTDPQNSGILAQSEQFSLTDDSDDTSSSASASATASASASASASGSASASATGSSSSASGSAATATVTQTSSGLTTVTGSASATASGTAASNASGSGTASGTATGSAASGTSTSAPSSASALKSTFAIFGSVAVAAYMLF